MGILTNPTNRIVLAICIAFVALVVMVEIAQGLDYPDDVPRCAYGEYEMIEGLATHVGPFNLDHPYRYPWRAVVRSRILWKQLPEDYEIENIKYMAALHLAMFDSVYIGKRAWVLSQETGRVIWVDIVDAMANPRAVIDLTPEGFGKLLGRSDGPGYRGGQNVTVLIPMCDYSLQREERVIIPLEGYTG